ncbi:50S ribosomal protein L9 [Oceanibacterium hippocampi]|uniref:Large ribosomal subunit protein bL9 n=1 Tax=Oceanibacterium hippocampi TaxID=745714 RepID=A0A1Y5STS3_9PROT|nr:50S ribosomal protein L9 [Oceanibacterium hippocampi]SLN48141.1 50S ribosomal protein L9 [Oceanibacterium hippocampi]
MEVILLERVEKLGQMGDVVKVKDGYARNYLLPRNVAQRATKANMAEFQQRRTQLEADNLQRKSEAQDIAGRMTGLSVVLIRQASDSAQLYGSVTARDIADAITAAGFSVDRRQVILDRALKTLGLTEIRVRLHSEVDVMVTINIARSEEEAGMQARGEKPGERDFFDDDDENDEVAMEAAGEEETDFAEEADDAAN